MVLFENHFLWKSFLNRDYYYNCDCLVQWWPLRVKHGKFSVYPTDVKMSVLHETKLIRYLLPQLVFTTIGKRGNFFDVNDVSTVTEQET